MSDTDGFIEEVTDELRRDKLFAAMRRYGWIVGLVVVLIVGAAAFNEYRKSQAQAQAQALGDSLLAALDKRDPEEQAAALVDISAETGQARAVRDLLLAAAQADAGNAEAAGLTLDNIVVNGDVPQVYRTIAQFKATLLRSDVTSADERRQSFEALAQPGNPIRLMAEEQLGLIDIETGDRDAAMKRFQSILSDAEVTPDLQERAVQVIVALGGEPELRAGQAAGQ